MNGLRNQVDLQQVIDKINKGKFKDQMCKGIEKCDWDKEEKIKHILAARYLDSIDKGPVAQELSCVIADNLCNKDKDKKQFRINIPNYIKEAIIWICQEQ